MGIPLKSEGYASTMEKIGSKTKISLICALRIIDNNPLRFYISFALREISQ